MDTDVRPVQLLNASSFIVNGVLIVVMDNDFRPIQLWNAL